MHNTDVRILIREAAINGVTLWAEDGQLHFKASKGKLTNALRSALLSRKNELIGELSPPIFRKRASPPAVARFPAFRKDFWEESEANPRFRHGTHFAIKLTGNIELKRIEAAFERLVLRHDLLRSRVRVADDGIPFLQLDNDPSASVDILDLSGSDAASAPLQVKVALERAIYEPFEDGRIYRAQIIKVSDVEYAVAVVIHHFVADPVSLEVVFRELMRGLQGAHDSQLQTDERPLQYADYLLGMNEWLTGLGFEYRLGLWKDKMRGVPGVRFPLTDASQDAGPSKLDVINIPVGETLRAKLAGSVAVAGVPFPLAILAVNFAALANTFQRRDFFTVLLHSGRHEEVLLDLVGFTVNCFPVRVTVAPRMSYIDLMTHVHDAFAFARDYHVPWGTLMPLLGDIGASYVAPLFNYMSVGMSVGRDAHSSLPTSPLGGGLGIERIAVEGPEQTNSVDWKSYELHAFDTGVEMRVTLKYMPSVYRTAAVKEFANTLLGCLEALADDPAGHVLYAPPALEPVGGS